MVSVSFTVGLLSVFALPTILLTTITLMVSRRILYFRRSDDLFEIKEGQIRLSTTRARSLSDLESAFVEERVMKRSDGSDGPTIYRATLQFSSSDGTECIPINETFGHGPTAEELVKAVNAWLSQAVDSPPSQA